MCVCGGGGGDRVCSSPYEILGAEVKFRTIWTSHQKKVVAQSSPILPKFPIDCSQFDHDHSPACKEVWHQDHPPACMAKFHHCQI